MSSFNVTITQRDGEKSGDIFFTITNVDRKVIKVQIHQLYVKCEGEENFRDRNFQVKAHCGDVDRSFKMELDPKETRHYGLTFDCVISYDYRIIFRSLDGVERTVEGKRRGISIAVMPQPGESPLDKPTIGMLVRIKPYPHRQVGGTFEVATEDGSENMIGIFSPREYTPGSYTGLGGEGYKRFIGQFYVEMPWMDDTVAPPPNNLWAVHLRNIETNEHGWFFHDDVLVLKSA